MWPETYAMSGSARCNLESSAIRAAQHLEQRVHFCPHAAITPVQLASGNEQPLGKRRAAGVAHIVCNHGPGDVWARDLANKWPLVGSSLLLWHGGAPHLPNSSWMTSWCAVPASLSWLTFAQ